MARDAVSSPANNVRNSMLGFGRFKKQSSAASDSNIFAATSAQNKRQESAAKSEESQQDNKLEQQQTQEQEPQQQNGKGGKRSKTSSKTKESKQSKKESISQKEEDIEERPSSASKSAKKSQTRKRFSMDFFSSTFSGGTSPSLETQEKKTSVAANEQQQNEMSESQLAIQTIQQKIASEAALKSASSASEADSEPTSPMTPTTADSNETPVSGKSVKERSFTKRYSSPIFGFSFTQKNQPGESNSYAKMPAVDASVEQSKESITNSTANFSDKSKSKTKKQKDKKDSKSTETNDTSSTSPKETALATETASPSSTTSAASLPVSKSTKMGRRISSMFTSSFSTKASSPLATSPPLKNPEFDDDNDNKDTEEPEQQKPSTVVDRQNTNEKSSSSQSSPKTSRRDLSSKPQPSPLIISVGKAAAQAARDRQMSKDSLSRLAISNETTERTAESNNAAIKAAVTASMEQLSSEFPPGWNRNRRPSADHRTQLQIEFENRIKEKLILPENDSLSNSNSGLKTSFDQGPAELFQPSKKNMSSLMLKTAFQENDILGDFLELQRGVGYFAKPIGNTQGLLGGSENLFVRINLLGIHISRDEVSQSLVEFAIEHVMTFSHNRSKQTFTFSYLHSDGILNEYKFQSEKYFEIFEALGSAISIVISMKERTANDETAPGRRIAAESVASGMNAGVSGADRTSSVDIGGTPRQGTINGSDTHVSTPTLSRRITSHYNDDGTHLDIPEANLGLQEQKILENAIMEQQSQRKIMLQKRERRKSFMPLEQSAAKSSPSSPVRPGVSADAVYQQQIGADPESKAAYESLSGNGTLQSIHSQKTDEDDSKTSSLERRHVQESSEDREMSTSKTMESPLSSPSKSLKNRLLVGKIGSKLSLHRGNNSSNSLVESEANSTSSSPSLGRKFSLRATSGMRKDSNGNLLDQDEKSRKASLAKFYLETRFKLTQRSQSEPQSTTSETNEKASPLEDPKTADADGTASRRWKTKKRFDYIQSSKQPGDSPSSDKGSVPSTPASAVDPAQNGTLKKRNRLSIFGGSKKPSSVITDSAQMNTPESNPEDLDSPANAEGTDGAHVSVPSPSSMGDPNCVVLSPADTLASPSKAISPMEELELKAQALQHTKRNSFVSGTPSHQKTGSWLKKGKTPNKDIREILNNPPTSPPPPVPTSRNGSKDQLKDEQVTDSQKRRTVKGMFSKGSRTSSNNALANDKTSVNESTDSPGSGTESEDVSPLKLSPNTPQTPAGGDYTTDADLPPMNKYTSLKKMSVGFSNFMRANKKRPNAMKAFASGDSIEEGSAEDKGPTIQKVVDEDGKEILITMNKQDGVEITAGTVDALITSLTGVPDLSYVEVFLLTFRHFTTPEMLMDTLTRMYGEAELGAQAEKRGEKSNVRSSPLAAGTEPAMLICHRIVSLVKKWVGEHTYDFLEPRTMDVLNIFLNLVSSGEYHNYADQIKRILTNELENLDSKKTDMLLAFSSLERAETTALLQNIDILSISAKKIAQQLTIVDSKLFRSIKVEEFAVMLWGGGSRDIRAQRLQAYIDRFNTIGYWTATSICFEENKQRRVAVLEKFVRIACRCFEIQNFNSSMAILSGINTTPVLRLQKTKAAMSSRLSSMLTDLEAKLSYKGNYKAYREIEHLAKQPLIPFFGLIIKDLTFMNDGNPKCLPNGLINFEKQRLISNYINQIREFQRYSFPFQPENEPLRAAKQTSAHHNIHIEHLSNNSTKSLHERELTSNSTMHGRTNANLHSNFGASVMAIGSTATTGTGLGRTIGAGDTNLYLYCCRPPCLAEEDIMEYSLKCESSQIQNRLALDPSVAAIINGTAVRCPAASTIQLSTAESGAGESNSAEVSGSLQGKSRMITSNSEPVLTILEDAEEEQQVPAAFQPRLSNAAGNNGSDADKLAVGSVPRARSISGGPGIPNSATNKSLSAIAMKNSASGAFNTGLSPEMSRKATGASGGTGHQVLVGSLVDSRKTTQLGVAISAPTSIKSSRRTSVNEGLSDALPVSAYNDDEDD